MTTARRLDKLRSLLGPDDRLRVCLVDQSAENSTRYSPLAIMYLKAAVLHDPELGQRVDVELLSFGSADSLTFMALEIQKRQPHVVGFSCQGWNFARFRDIMPTVRQCFPDSIVMIGGNHVSNQAQLLPRLPEVDILVSGEAEHTFVELLRALLDKEPAPLDRIRGISFREGESGVRTTELRPRVTSIDELPVPYSETVYPLSGIDIALVETNRGCPYKCAYCYWGAAVGQRVARAEGDWFAQQLAEIAKAKIPIVWACDANFGILERDIDTAKLVVDSYRRTGYPSVFMVTWAKNHVDRVEQIMSILREGGLRGDFLLPLQTMSTETLKMADRDMIGRSKFLDLARRLTASDVSVGCELIYGLPGETPDEFFEGYDSIFRSFTKTLIHPLIILPSTAYSDRREQLGIITVKPDPLSDYDYVLMHKTLSTEMNRDGLGLLMTEFIVVAMGFARSLLRALVFLSEEGATRWLRRFEEFINHSPRHFYPQLKEIIAAVRRQVYFDVQQKAQVRGLLFASREGAYLALQDFIDSQSQLDEETRKALQGFALYDTLLLPRADLMEDKGWVRETRALPFDAQAAIRHSFRTGELSLDLIRDMSPCDMVIEHASGFGGRFDKDMIDLGGRWVGRVVGVEPLGIPAGGSFDRTDAKRSAIHGTAPN